jgi:hypothetical protein
MATIAVPNMIQQALAVVDPECLVAYTLRLAEKLTDAY